MALSRQRPSQRVARLGSNATFASSHHLPGHAEFSAGGKDQTQQLNLWKKTLFGPKGEVFKGWILLCHLPEAFGLAGAAGSSSAVAAAAPTEVPAGSLSRQSFAPVNRSK